MENYEKPESVWRVLRPRQRTFLYSLTYTSVQFIITCNKSFVIFFFLVLYCIKCVCVFDFVKYLSMVSINAKCFPIWILHNFNNNYPHKKLDLHKNDLSWINFPHEVSLKRKFTCMIAFKSVKPIANCHTVSTWTQFQQGEIWRKLLHLSQSLWAIKRCHTVCPINCDVKKHIR